MNSESFSFVNYILAPLLSTIISVSISVLVNKIIVEKGQKRRLHSTILNDMSLKIWLDKIDELIKGDIEYSHDNGKMIAIDLENFQVIPYYQSLESHMKTGYSKEWNLWKELSHKVRNFYEKRANLSEKLRQTFIKESKELNLNEFYYQPGKTQPENYVQPDKIAELILKEIKQRLSGFEEWWGGEPTIDYFMLGSKKIYRLKIFDGGDLIHDVNTSNIEFCKKFIVSTVKKPMIIQEVKKLSKIYDENNIKRKFFKDELKKISSQIDLGKNLKGKCDACP